MAKHRWIVERDYPELKQEVLLGLNDESIHRPKCRGYPGRNMTPKAAEAPAVSEIMNSSAGRQFAGNRWRLPMMDNRGSFALMWGDESQADGMSSAIGLIAHFADRLRVERRYRNPLHQCRSADACQRT